MGGVTLDEVMGSRCETQSEIGRVSLNQESHPNPIADSQPLYVDSSSLSLLADSMALSTADRQGSVEPIENNAASGHYKEEPLPSSTRWAVTGDLDVPAFLRRRRHTGR